MTTTVNVVRSKHSYWGESHDSTPDYEKSRMQSEVREEQFGLRME